MLFHGVLKWFGRREGTLGLSLVTAVFCLRYVDNNIVSISIIKGRSMQPVFNPEGCTTTDIVLLDRTPLWEPHLLKRGDIVTYRNPRAADEYNIKRIVGLPGDRITTVGYKQKFVTVPAGHCWVEGDNVRHSDDSNKVGPVPMGLIRGRATCLIYPPSRWGSLERKLPVSRVEIADEDQRMEAATLPLVNDTPFGIFSETPIY